MTNQEKYKTLEERAKAFGEFCRFNCSNCQLRDSKCSCALVWLELETPNDDIINLNRTISKKAVVATEKTLIDNGIDEDEASDVLQDVGYTLLDTELYPNERTSEQ